jgi:hypothetical protein
MDEKKKLTDEEEKKTPDTHEEKKDEPRLRKSLRTRQMRILLTRNSLRWTIVRLTRTVRVLISLRKISRLISQTRISPTSRTMLRTHLTKKTRRYSGSKLR